MLRVGRKFGEGVWIGKDIFVRVERRPTAGGVRLAIQAPKDVKVLREELSGAPRRSDRVSRCR